MATATVQNPKKSRSARRRRLTPERRREELLEAVEQVVIADGYQGMSVPRVVSAAGVSQGSFYRHFEHIDDAFLALTARVLQPIEEAAFALQFDGVGSAADVERRLHTFFQVLATQLERRGTVIREAFLVAPASRGTAAVALSGFLARMRTHAQHLVEQVEGRFPFRELDPPAVAGAIVGMILGAAYEAAERGPRFEAQAWAREMARFEAGALTLPVPDPTTA